MTYDLFIGDRTFSSWSLRGWLMFEKFGLPVRTHMVGLYAGTMNDDLAPLHPARLVPVMRDSDGVIVFDSLAMGETLAERHPDTGFWPKDPAARALARSITAEMHAGFTALRGECPMQLMHQVNGFTPSQTALSELERLETLWSLARTQHGISGPWLFGDYCLADVFYAPIAARIAGYGLNTSASARNYVHTTLHDIAFRQWRAMGLTKTYDPNPYETGLSTQDWPGPKPLKANPVEHGPAVNTDCPYSGKPVAHFLETDGRVFGFCNAFCRDKTVQDPDAWPKFTKLRDSH